jgi:hypothetical protein
MRGFYASRWEVGVPARRRTVLVADDLLVREDHRNRGLVTRIMQAAYDGLRDSEAQFLFNLSGGKLTVLGSLTMGWRSIGMLKPLGRRCRGGALCRSLRFHLSRAPYLWRYTKGDLLYSAAERLPFKRLDHADNPFATRTGPAVEIDVCPRPKAMAALIDRIGHDGRLRHVRDEQYFDWRFRDPLREYRFLYMGKDALDGYLVLIKRDRRPRACPAGEHRRSGSDKRRRAGRAAGSRSGGGRLRRTRHLVRYGERSTPEPPCRERVYPGRSGADRLRLPVHIGSTDQRRVS